ncbi:MAG: GNAT family N-acetyltransferase [Proteobacteria bacterium]|nr:GNAT family N-acetyltransferase [Pseudomonadota bacterium]
MIRTAAPGDIAQILDLCRAHAAYEKARYVEDRQGPRLARALFSAEPSMHAWVVDEGAAELLGYMTAVTEFATWPARAFVYMDTLYLREHARRQGWGQRLIATLSDFARARGAREIQWQTPPWNDDAIAFYRRIGADEADKVRFTLRLP